MAGHLNSLEGAARKANPQACDLCLFYRGVWRGRINYPIEPVPTCYAPQKPLHLVRRIQKSL
ncbi:MAG UNVERIFIED_CONTAM: hypothetical protein LVT10_11980 [Anaerolineae bacterium]